MSPCLAGRLSPERMWHYSKVTQLVLTEMRPKPGQAPQTRIKGRCQTGGIIHKNDAPASDEVAMSEGETRPVLREHRSEGRRGPTLGEPWVSREMKPKCL